MGTYSIQVDWLANAYKGVPLGEMVQWSDLIASLYALGHDITISAEQPSMKKYVLLCGAIEFLKLFWLSTMKRLEKKLYNANYRVNV